MEGVGLSGPQLQPAGRFHSGHPSRDRGAVWGCDLTSEPSSTLQLPLPPLLRCTGISWDTGFSQPGAPEWLLGECPLEGNSARPFWAPRARDQLLASVLHEQGDGTPSLPGQGDGESGCVPCSEPPLQLCRPTVLSTSVPSLGAGLWRRHLVSVLIRK